MAASFPPGSTSITTIVNQSQRPLILALRPKEAECKISEGLNRFSRDEWSDSLSNKIRRLGVSSLTVLSQDINSFSQSELEAKAQEAYPHLVEKLVNSIDSAPFRAGDVPIIDNLGNVWPEWMAQDYMELIHQLKEGYGIEIINSEIADSLQENPLVNCLPASFRVHEFAQSALTLIHEMAPDRAPDNYQEERRPYLFKEDVSAYNEETKKAKESGDLDREKERLIQKFQLYQRFLSAALHNQELQELTKQQEQELLDCEKQLEELFVEIDKYKKISSSLIRQNAEKFRAGLENLSEEHRKLVEDLQSQNSKSEERADRLFTFVEELKKHIEELKEKLRSAYAEMGHLRNRITNLENMDDDSGCTIC